MLKYKRVNTGTLTDGAETLVQMIAGNKNRKYHIRSITTDPLANMYLRVYKDADQIVDIQSIAMTSAAPLLPMDLAVDVGEIVRVGFYNNGAATTAKEITIGYEEMRI